MSGLNEEDDMPDDKDSLHSGVGGGDQDMHEDEEEEKSTLQTGMCVLCRLDINIT
jgi:hypothetical protein